MPWNYNLSYSKIGRGPKIVYYANGLAVNRGDLVLPAQLLNGTNTGTPGDGTAISAYHCINGGVLGAEPGSNWPGAAEDATPTCGTVVFRSKNLIHIDFSALADGSGSQGSPRSIQVGAVNGRVCVIRRGTSRIAALTGSSGNPGQFTTGWVTWYATTDAEVSAQAPTVVVSVSNTRNVVVDGIRSTGQSAAASYTNGMSITQTAADCTGVCLRRNELIGGPVQDSANNNGIAILGTGATVDMGDNAITLEDNTITNWGGYGIGMEGIRTKLNGARSVHIWGNRITDCGFRKVSWGIGVYPEYVQSNGSQNIFSKVSGTVYSRTDTKLVLRAGWDGADGRFLPQTAGLQSTPGAFEWGVVPGSPNTIYINLNVDTGSTLTGLALVFMSYTYADGILAENNTVIRQYGNVDSSGIGFDNQTAGCTARNNVTLNCSGEGYVSNKGSNNVFYGNVSSGDCVVLTTRPAINVNAGNLCKIYNNTILNSNGLGIGGSSRFDPMDVRNNIIHRAAGVAIGVDYNVSSTINFNARSLCAAGGTTGANDVAVNATAFISLPDGSLAIPTTATLASLSAINPLAVSGTYVQGVDLKNGRARPGYSPIGAYQAVLPRLLSV